VNLKKALVKSVSEAVVDTSIEDAVVAMSIEEAVVATSIEEAVVATSIEDALRCFYDLRLKFHRYRTVS
jgi:hypothetical protein